MAEAPEKMRQNHVVFLAGRFAWHLEDNLLASRRQSAHHMVIFTSKDFGTDFSFLFLAATPEHAAPN